MVYVLFLGFYEPSLVGVYSTRSAVELAICRRHPGMVLMPSLSDGETLYYGGSASEEARTPSYTVQIEEVKG